MNGYRRTLVWIALFCFVAGFTFTCDPPEEEESSEPDKCGGEARQGWHRNELEVSDYIESPLRCVNFWKEIKDVCTYEHVTARFRFEQKRSKTWTGTLAYAEIWYGLGWYELQVEMEYSESFKEEDERWSYLWFGEVSFGLKHYYGEGPGEFFMDFKICFPIKGDGEDDMEFFDEYIHDLMSFTVHGKKHKES